MVFFQSGIGTRIAVAVAPSMKSPSCNERSLGVARRRAAFFAASAYVLITSAQAHPGHYHPPDEVDEFDSFAAGFLHPFTGLDHALLALAVGWLLLTRLSRSALLQSACFLIAILGGATLGRATGSAPGLEFALAGTVLCLSLLMLLRKHLRAAFLLSVSSLTGLVHGLAHGAEAAPLVIFAYLATGVLAGTAVLMAIGGLLGHASTVVRSSLPSRIAGSALLTFGAVFLWNAI